MKLTDEDYREVAERHAVSPLALRAVVDVEAASSGFVKPGFPRILFEGHVFYRETKGRFSEDHPTISYPTWTKAYYWGGIREYDRLVEAMRLDTIAALRATSWGLGQVMGFNHRNAGYSSIRDFVNAMGESERLQLEAMMAFIETKGLIYHMRKFPDILACRSFAKAYNGPGYEKNAYHTKLRDAYMKHSVAGLEVRRIQRALVDSGWKIAIDGIMGPQTKTAIAEFQAANGLTPDGIVGPKTAPVLFGES